QAVELHLFCVVFAADHRLEIDLHPRLGRAPSEQTERVAGELCLRNKRRKTGKQKNRDRPWGEVRQQHAVAHQRDAVLNEPERPHDETQRAARSLPTGTCQLVIELRVLEVLQLESECLLENHDVDTLTELCTK